MELLARFGTPAQKRRWLQPLLDGKIRSCFAMTEPDVASSDPTSLQASIQQRGDKLVINGRKWWTSGAMDTRCEMAVFLGRGPKRASEQLSRHENHTIVLIPMKTPGIHVKRPMHVFGYDDAPHGHAETLFRNVTISMLDAVLLGVGRGFEAAQSRLGGGRLHHCMRAVGLGERALSLMLERASKRTAFGKPLLENSVVKHQIAESRCDIEAARNIVLTAARAADGTNSSAKKRAVSIAKVTVPKYIARVIDRALQVHGGQGVSQDTILAKAYADMRALRLADGPDEVHLASIAKMEIRAAKL